MQIFQDWAFSSLLDPSSTHFEARRNAEDWYRSEHPWPRRVQKLHVRVSALSRPLCTGRGIHRHAKVEFPSGFASVLFFVIFKKMF